MTTKREALCYQISSLPNSYIPKIENFFANLQSSKEPTHRISAFNEPTVIVKEPKLSQWDYLDQDKVETLLKLTAQREIYEFIASTLKNHPKGKPKDMFIQLIMDVAKFCQINNYDIEKTATVLSQFYQTHNYFTTGVEVTAEKVYIHFKDLIMCHSLPFPPSKKKIFSIKEARDILEFFCKVYLRNLPLIKYLCWPNYALYLNYEIPPPPVLSFKGKKKGKKGKDKKAKKGAKKKK